MPRIAVNATATPPPLPPRPQIPARAVGPVRRHRFGLPGWLIALIAACLLLFVLMGGLVAWGVGMGWDLFATQAQAALQEQPAVREHIGTINEMHVDLVATGAAPGAEEFVFRLQGDRGSGKATANFVSMGAESEIITAGVLELSGGQRFALEDQSADDSDECADEACTDDSADDDTYDDSDDSDSNDGEVHA